MSTAPVPAGYLDVVPEVIFEVRSPTDRWLQILIRVSESLVAGIGLVCVLDQETEEVYVFHAENGLRVLPRGANAIPLAKTRGANATPLVFSR